MARVAEFAKAVASVVGGAREYRIHRSVWGDVVEPLPQRSGSWSFRDGDAVVEVSRFDSLYGYLRLRSGDCLAEGVLEYRQWYVVFRPQRVEGRCGGSAAALGVEAVEEDED